MEVTDFDDHDEIIGQTETDAERQSKKAKEDTKAGDIPGDDSDEEFDFVVPRMAFERDDDEDDMPERVTDQMRMEVLRRHEQRSSQKAPAQQGRIRSSVDAQARRSTTKRKKTSITATPQIDRIEVDVGSARPLGQQGSSSTPEKQGGPGQKDGQQQMDGEGQDDVEVNVNVNVKAAARRRLVRTLKETHMVSSKGLGGLQARAWSLCRSGPSGHRLKGPGHETSDLARIMGMYAEWSRELFPRESFQQTMAAAGRLARKGRVRGHMEHLRELEAKFRQQGSAAPPERSSEEEEELRQRRREILGLPEEQPGLGPGLGGSGSGADGQDDVDEAGEEAELLAQLAQQADSGWANSGAALEAADRRRREEEEDDEEAEFQGLAEVMGYADEAEAMTAGHGQGQGQAPMES